MSTTWLNEAEMRAWRSYIETTANLENAFERDLAAHDLTLGDYQVLVFLSEADDRSMRMCDLADALQLSPSGLTRRLDGLVKCDLVRRVRSEDDRRVMMAVLADAGRARLTEAAPDHVASVRRRLFDHLDDEQIEMMGTIFEAISAALAADDADQRSSAA